LFVIPAANSYDSMKKTSSTCDYAIAHNGILSNFSSYKKDVSYNDTMDFIKNYLYKLVNLTNLSPMDDRISDLIEKAIGPNNKLAIMSKKGNIKRINTFYKKDGYYFSNLNWCRRYPSYPSNNNINNIDFNPWGLYLD